MVDSTLTPNLRIFWDRLNTGKIDWTFLLSPKEKTLEAYIERTDEEVRRAQEILMERRFLTYNSQERIENTKEYEKLNASRPLFNGRAVFFKGEKYCKGYLKYLTQKSEKKA